MLKKTLSISSSLLLAVACGGGGGGGGSSLSTSGGSIGQSISAQFIDAPVVGLKVEKDSGNGETGANGKFTCKAGESITFKVKDLEIGNASCGEKIYISDLGANANKAAAVLQSFAKSSGGNLDLSDLNASGLTLAGNIDLNANIDDEIDAFFTTFSADVTEFTKVTLAAAEAHVESNLPDLSEDAILAELAADGEQIVTLDRVGGDAEECWDQVSAKLELEAVGKAYKFKVNTYYGHDAGLTPNQMTTCTSSEQEVDGKSYDCEHDPIVPRIMSSRTISVIDYEVGNYSAAANAVIACIQDGSQYYMLEEAGGSCEVGYDDVHADKAYDIDYNGGFSFVLNVSDTGYTIKYNEQNFYIEPNEDTFDTDNMKVGLKSKKFECKFAKSESF